MNPPAKRREPEPRQPFEDREQAGDALAALLGSYHGAKNTIVIGLAHGGMPVAEVVAEKLRLPLESWTADPVAVPGQLALIGETAARLKGRSVILVDDGVATGCTMRAAIRKLRAMRAAKCVAATPVCSAPAALKLLQEADDLFFCVQPGDFLAIDQYYRRFPKVTTGEVREILERSRLRQSKAPATPLPSASALLLSARASFGLPLATS